MKKVKLILPTLGSLLLISIILLVLFSWQNEKLDIEENKMFAVGTVIKSHYIKSRGNYIEYEFTHEGVFYRAHQPTGHKIQTRQCYLVEYSSKKPNHSRMLTSESRKCN